MKKIIYYTLGFFLSCTLLTLVLIFIFLPILTAKHLIFPFAINPFDICEKYPETWSLIKYAYFICFIISYLIVYIFIINSIQKYRIYKQTMKPAEEDFVDTSKLCLKVGKDDTGKITYIGENGLYQNIFITGTIGSGKTSSAMYPFTKQLISYSANDPSEKLALLILDVKGNYYKEVLKYAKETGRQEDIILIDLNGNSCYNPLDKPNLKPIVLANRLKTILTLFSQNNGESYWLDKAEQILAECIKLCRLYNNGYVTFAEIHKLIMFSDYFVEKCKVITKLFQSGILSEAQVFELNSCIDFFNKEFFSLDERTLSILKSEISRITNIFTSDYTVSKTFCPQEENITFNGFHDVLNSGKIVVLNMNIAEYKNLSKIIAAYLKLDFQTEVMSRLGTEKQIRKSAFISDEYHEYVTTTDSDFFAQSREAKCINIVATQSYSSISNAIKDKDTTKVILQNLINKLWFRTDDIFTIEDAQKQIGKEEKEKISTTIAENAKETNFSFITNSLVSRDSNISESYNKSTQKDYVFDTNFFSQSLKTFECIAFLSNGFNILKPTKLTMFPYFKKEVNSNEK